VESVLKFLVLKPSVCFGALYFDGREEVEVGLRVKVILALRDRQCRCQAQLKCCGLVLWLDRSRRLERLIEIGMVIRESYRLETEADVRKDDWGVREVRLPERPTGEERL